MSDALSLTVNKIWDRLNLLKLDIIVDIQRIGGRSFMAGEDTKMIEVAAVLDNVPEYDRFRSQEELEARVHALRSDEAFQVDIAGHSAMGRPIHHLKFGTGSKRALFVGFPHCMEPIGGLTVDALMLLLHRRLPTLIQADVEWHIIPSIDPDGALLNEVWNQQPVTLGNLRRNFYAQAPRDQADMSFPVHHKRLHWTSLSQEAEILKRIIDRVRPDFYYSLHNAWTGGACYFLTRDIGAKTYHRIYRMLEALEFPLARRPLWREVCAEYAPAFAEMFTITKHYDYLERSSDCPESFFQWGASSFEYLTSIKPEALSFVAEMGYVRHPDDESDEGTGENLRRFKLHVDAENKYLATVLLEAWDAVADQVNRDSPYYASLFGGTVLPDRDRLQEGGRPLGRYTTRDLLLNPGYDKEMTVGERFETCFDGAFFFQLFSYQFVRLLKDSVQTTEIRQAIDRLERAYDDAQALIDGNVDPSKFRTIDCASLARVQIGSGLHALNAVLESQF